MAQHDRLRIDAGVQVYFCDPLSPWQRGTNENANRLLRQLFPKGTDLSIHSADEIAAVAAARNARPWRRLALHHARQAGTERFIESFNGRLRDEFLNQTTLTSLAQARALLEEWRRDYNGVRHTRGSAH
jgi:IS30 family transposase